jgi:hypothetical protein
MQIVWAITKIHLTAEAALAATNSKNGQAPPYPVVRITDLQFSISQSHKIYPSGVSEPINYTAKF